MSSTPRQLMECAIEVLETAKTEPHYRAVCSRAYYAAFHAAKAFHNALPVPGSVGEARGSHQQLIAQLANPQCGKQHEKFYLSKALSKSLRPLIDARVKADYSMDSAVDKTLAIASTEGAQTVVDRAA